MLIARLLDYQNKTTNSQNTNITKNEWCSLMLCYKCLCHCLCLCLFVGQAMSAHHSKVTSWWKYGCGGDLRSLPKASGICNCSALKRRDFPSLFLFILPHFLTSCSHAITSSRSSSSTLDWLFHFFRDLPHFAHNSKDSSQ